MQTFSVTFLPGDHKARVTAGKTLLEAARENNIPVNAPCGGKGLCGGCAVQIIEPQDLPLGDEDCRRLTSYQLQQGFRLACCLRVNRSLKVRLPQPEEIPRAKLELLELESAEIKPQGPVLRKVLFTPGQASLENLNIPLKHALLDALPPGSSPALPLDVAAKFAELMQTGHDRLTLLVEGDTLVGAEPGDSRGKIFGAAVDIGTTTIALYLCDLANGRILASDAATNSQTAYGADVMSRIGYTLEEREGRENLTRIVRGDIGKLAYQACRRAGTALEHIYRWTLVGNTTMQHLFLGLDPSPLGRSPFLPLVNGAVRFDPGELGLPGARFSEGLFLPTVAGHVGADTVAVALAAHLDRCEKLTLAIDLGTNGEIVLAEQGRMLCCSTAAGPAFEGAKIQHGMRAETGAIDRFWIDEKGLVNYHVIGDKSLPQGICGSGLVEIVSELLRLGIIDKSGRILPPEELSGSAARKLGERLAPEKNGQWSIIISESKEDAGSSGIMLTQRDVRELQLAVGAISSGIQVLLSLAGRTPDDIEAVLLTGAFGHYIQPASAIGVGLIRGVALERIRSIGNAAGLGARLALVSAEERKRAIQIAGRMEFVELATRPDWQDKFTEAMFFPGQ
ncbi:MAG TPA: ASKHA domain-containing protein [archaeon]|nr:ASKHA domain-containing protein [archaeon]